MAKQSILQWAQALGEEANREHAILATAESLTAGAIAAAITEVAGSSAWFERGFITYWPIAKEEMLGVRHATIAQFGVVSEETAREMAQGALGHSHATWTVAVTGIAGPTGAEVGKPVGTVCFGFANKDGWVTSQTRHFLGDRQDVREQTVEYALKSLTNFLLKE